MAQRSITLDAADVAFLISGLRTLNDIYRSKNDPTLQDLIDRNTRIDQSICEQTGEGA